MANVWMLAEDALVAGDAGALEAWLLEHGQTLRRGPVQSTWWGGLAPDYTAGDANAIVAREHGFESWDAFAAFAGAIKDGRSPMAQFEAAVEAIVSGDAA